MIDSSFVLNLRLQIIQLTLKILQLQMPPSNKKQVLYNVALACQGKDMAPHENEYGCAEAVNSVYLKAFGEPIGGGLSTWLMVKSLQDLKRFKRVLEPSVGCVIISPSGYGKLPNGHVGIVGENNTVMSNTSKNGLWQSNYTIDSWKQKYEKVGGFPVWYFEPI